jgi:hypothetical protein
VRWTLGRFITKWPEPRRDAFGAPYDPSIYFVSAGGLTKIGWASDPFRRICQLAIGCPAPLLLEAYVPGSEMTEHRLHRAFASHREHGEWFRQNPRLRALLNELTAAMGDRDALANIVRRWTSNLERRRWEVA